MERLDTQRLERFISTLERSLAMLKSTAPESVDYEVYRNAVIKGFELTLETSGKLLGKALRPYFAAPGDTARLPFKDLFQNALSRGLLEPEAVERWFAYRDNRDSTAHDYGVAFAEDTLALLPRFIDDARALSQVLKRA